MALLHLFAIGGRAPLDFQVPSCYLWQENIVTLESLKRETSLHTHTHTFMQEPQMIKYNLTFLLILVSPIEAVSFVSLFLK